MIRPDNHVVVGQPVRPVKIAAVDGDAGIALVTGLVLAVAVWIKLKPVGAK